MNYMSRSTRVLPVLPPNPRGKVSRRAKIRGLPQLGTLGAGNHYAEIQVVEEVFDPQAAKKMGIDKVNQVCMNAVRGGFRGSRNGMQSVRYTAYPPS